MESNIREDILKMDIAELNIKTCELMESNLPDIKNINSEQYPFGISSPLGWWAVEDDWRTGGEHWVIQKYPAQNIEEAWEVFNYAMETAWFSKRQKFFRELQEQTRTEDGVLIAWPDVLNVLRKEMPEAICKAFLLVELQL